MQINLRLPPAYRYLCQYEIQQQTNDRRKPPVPDGMDGDYPSTGPQLENARRGTRQSGEHPDRLAKNRTLSADLHHPQQPDRSQTVTAKTSLCMVSGRQSADHYGRFSLVAIYEKYAPYDTEPYILNGKASFTDLAIYWNILLDSS